MIPKEELMIGSWVRIPELEDGDFNNGYTKIKQLGNCDLDTWALSEIGYDEIEPIPLTQELLEKIGLGYKNDYGFKCFPETDYPGYIKGDSGFEYCFPTPKYVHQLQMILVSCKIKLNISL